MRQLTVIAGAEEIVPYICIQGPRSKRDQGE